MAKKERAWQGGGLLYSSRVQWEEVLHRAENVVTVRKACSQAVGGGLSLLLAEDRAHIMLHLPRHLHPPFTYYAT